MCRETIPQTLFMPEDLEEAYDWLFKIRKDYSHNSEIWNFRRDWHTLKDSLLDQLNDGSYDFGLIDRYDIDGAIISVWSCRDMLALKLIANALNNTMADDLPKSCTHVKGHGGLKRAVKNTHAAISKYKFVLRSDIKRYYDSIDFDVLMKIIQDYVKHPILLTLICKALQRTETRGGNFYSYFKRGLPKGSPLAPLLGAIALMPLDIAMQNTQGIFYQRYMDDWVVLAKSKTALRKVIKKTHQILEPLKLTLHPLKTYIGRINHGFNFLGYYFDDTKILPSRETIRRFDERATALYEKPQEKSHHRHKKATDRDISEYPVNEAAPCNAMLKKAFAYITMALASGDEALFKRMRRYVQRWSAWTKLGLYDVDAFTDSVNAYLPLLSSCLSGEVHQI